MNISKRLEVLENRIISGKKNNILFLTTGDPKNEELREAFLKDCKKKNIHNPVIFFTVKPSLDGKR